MEYTLVSFVLVLWMFTKDTNGLSVNISPIPASVNAGKNLIVTAIITKTELESWRSFLFYVGGGAVPTSCNGAAYSDSAACTDIFGCSYGFGFTCNYTHFNLFIDNVNTSLLGRAIYAEVTIDKNSKVTSVPTTIKVKIPLKGVSLTPNGTITKTESDIQVFRCFARSLPIAKLSWVLSGSIVTTSSPPLTTTDTVTSTYTYTAQKDDNGKRLSCTAVYDSSSFTEDVYINVFYRPIVIVSPNYKPYRVLENETDLQLTCIETDANPTVTSFTWKKDGSTISGTANYTIPTVHRSQAGSYTCSATNSVGNSDPSNAIQLEVLYGAEIVPISKKEPYEGTQLFVTCSGQSNPVMTDNDVTWTKQNNSTFIMKGKQLVIENVNRVDSGTYVCSVVIKLIPTIGQPLNVTGRTTVEVDVLYLPNITISPNHAQYNVIENTTNLELDCTVVDANPAVMSYRWYKDGSVIDGSTDASYTISTVRRSHTGRYTCDATNAVGSSDHSSGIQLKVLYGVDFNSISNKTQTEGNQLTITCVDQSYPVITRNDIKWSKKNNITFSRVGLQLVIDNVNRLDSGTYVCTVVTQLTPTVGLPVNVTGTFSVQVDVLYRPDVTTVSDQNPYKVIENTTNLHLTCNVTDANPNVTSYKWYKDGVEAYTAATYTISKVYRSHAGSYTCDATNSVGSSDPSSVLQLDVLYGVSLKLSRTETSTNESERWEFSCIGDGNPVPEINCVYRYNRTTVGEQNANVTTVSVDHANCMDTGLYMCSGSNTIGETVSQSVDIEVACKPRTYNNVDERDIFINGADENLNISTTFISYPLSDISWFRQLLDGSLIDLKSEFMRTTISSGLPYATISNLQKEKLEQNEFGIYFVKAFNIHGSYLLKYHVIPKRIPDPPTNITTSCDVTSITVSWISRFNGGEIQTFRIKYVNNFSNKTISTDGIADKGRNEIINEVVEPLSPDTLYSIFLEAENVYGITKSTEHANCSTRKNQKDNQPVPSAVVGGITGSISAILIVVVIGGLYLWRRRKHSEGLRNNPLYVTSGETSNDAVVPVYGVVNKQTQNKEKITIVENTDHGPVYSQVQKPNTKGKQKQMVKKAKINLKNDNYNDIELGTVYDKSDTLLDFEPSNELYANAGEQENGEHLEKVFSLKKNKDGLIYADLDLIPTSSGKKFIIRGLENRTNYAIIDLSKKAEPLPSDDEDNEKDNENVKSFGDERNE